MLPVDSASPRVEVIGAQVALRNPGCVMDTFATRSREKLTNAKDGPLLEKIGFSKSPASRPSVRGDDAGGPRRRCRRHRHN